MKRSRPKTYEADLRGKKIRVTVPQRHETVAYSGEAVEVLRDVLRDSLSPQAIAAIAAHLHGIVKTSDEKVNGEAAWFTGQLLELLGDQYNALCEELGL
jgi:hypothetical protein